MQEEVLVAVNRLLDEVEHLKRLMEAYSRAQEAAHREMVARQSEMGAEIRRELAQLASDLQEQIEEISRRAAEERERGPSPEASRRGVNWQEVAVILGGVLATLLQLLGSGSLNGGK